MAWAEAAWQVALLVALLVAAAAVVTALVPLTGSTCRSRRVCSHCCMSCTRKSDCWSNTGLCCRASRTGPGRCSTCATARATNNVNHGLEARAARCAPATFACGRAFDHKCAFPITYVGRLVPVHPLAVWRYENVMCQAVRQEMVRWIRIADARDPNQQIFGAIEGEISLWERAAVGEVHQRQESVLPWQGRQWRW